MSENNDVIFGWKNNTNFESSIALVNIILIHVKASSPHVYCNIKTK